MQRFGMHFSYEIRVYLYIFILRMSVVSQHSVMYEYFLFDRLFDLFMTG